ncbi:cytochrome c [Phenylobacterium sp.]|jgi:mono/diheme cytochrome c family protein|uniref:c-type cytochrome n=1 Tax=Phenylobacterium sp. TaxID=1871053 RepID=UPI002E37EDCA|nr:cytochrome c [Phenylobacterium sp.]HEX3365686.1 cytochrome c [Phenylobacterium sp.]
MKRWLGLLLRLGLPWAAGLASVGVVGLGVVLTGAFNTTASTPHAAPIAWVTHLTMTNAVKRNATQLSNPPAFTPADVLDGARTYDANCGVCHGGPGVARAPWVGGMTPSPPFLLDASRNWTSKELFWIVRYGVRMTGMPAWDQTLSEHDVWNLVAFLKALPNMSAADYARATAAQPAPAGSGLARTP